MLGAMPEPQNVQHLLEDAKRAADAGDLAGANALLQEAARIQESELGPLHPELANTVNNLAVVAEMDRRLPDAEACYRRAFAIASQSLPPDDPIIASSRKNLEDFCREHGLPVDRPTVVLSSQSSDRQPHDVATAQTADQMRRRAHVDVLNATVAAPLSSGALDTRPATDPRVDAVEESSAPTSTSRRSLLLVGIAVVAVVAAVLLVARPWSARDSPAPPQIVEPAAPPAAEPAPPHATAAAPAPVEQPQPAAVASREDRTGGSPPSAASGAPSSGGMTLVTSQLCRTLSTGHNWRCDPAGQSVAPGPLVLYTRVKSPRDGVVIHQWYRGSTLRKSARLPIQANTTDGYRTYSRQTVNRGEDWRIEVRTPSGDLLYEQRVSVR
jgi:hypothetical protein